MTLLTVLRILMATLQKPSLFIAHRSHEQTNSALKMVLHCPVFQRTRPTHLIKWSCIPNAYASMEIWHTTENGPANQTKYSPMPIQPILPPGLAGGPEIKSFIRPDQCKGASTRSGLSKDLVSRPPASQTREERIYLVCRPPSLAWLAGAVL